MNNLLLVIDMQNDFITGALGTPEAAAILPKVREKLASFNGRVLFTRDTHGEDYLDTREGKLLPVPHCIGGTKGWEIEESLQKYALKVFDKPTFGSLALAERLVQANREQKLDEVQLIGLCTDICVISNALILKAALPETVISVDGSCCAGVTPEAHENALAAMRQCQVEMLSQTEYRA